MLSECDANDEYQQLLNGYLGAVISETLRLYHPVAWYARKTVRQAIVTDSKGASHAIPANTIIMINVAAMGRHPQHWPSKNSGAERAHSSPALGFDPSRWLEGEDQGDHAKRLLCLSARPIVCAPKKGSQKSRCAPSSLGFSASFRSGWYWKTLWSRRQNQQATIRLGWSRGRRSERPMRCSWGWVSGMGYIPSLIRRSRSFPDLEMAERYSQNILSRFMDDTGSAFKPVNFQILMTSSNPWTGTPSTRIRTTAISRLFPKSDPAGYSMSVAPSVNLTLLIQAANTILRHSPGTLSDRSECSSPHASCMRRGVCM